MIDRKKELPLIVASAGNDSLLDLYRGSRRELEEALLVHGAILFRGFGIHTQGMLERAARDIGGKALDYVDGNSPRHTLGGGVYTSTEDPPGSFISRHNARSHP